MAAAPRWKVYSAEGDYRAACKDIVDAAALMGMYNPGSTIRDGHSKSSIVWTEGLEGDGGDGIAADSYDEVTIRVMDRVARRQRERNVRNRGWQR